MVGSLTTFSSGDLLRDDKGRVVYVWKNSGNGRKFLAYYDGSFEDGKVRVALKPEANIPRVEFDAFGKVVSRALEECLGLDLDLLNGNLWQRMHGREVYNKIRKAEEAQLV